MASRNQSLRRLTKTESVDNVVMDRSHEVDVYELKDLISVP